MADIREHHERAAHHKGRRSKAASPFRGHRLHAIEYLEHALKKHAEEHR